MHPTEQLSTFSVSMYKKKEILTCACYGFGQYSLFGCKEGRKSLKRRRPCARQSMCLQDDIMGVWNSPTPAFCCENHQKYSSHKSQFLTCHSPFFFFFFFFFTKSFQEYNNSFTDKILSSPFRSPFNRAKILSSLSSSLCLSGSK